MTMLDDQTKRELLAAIVASGTTIGEWQTTPESQAARMMGKDIRHLDAIDYHVMAAAFVRMADAIIERCEKG